MKTEYQIWQTEIRRRQAELERRDAQVRQQASERLLDRLFGRRTANA